MGLVDARPVDLDRAQQDLGEGPCLDASEHGEHMISPDLRVDPRFPRYAPVAAGLGFVAQVGLSLFVSPESRGALNLYSERPRAFGDLTDLAPLFADQTTLALGYAPAFAFLTRLSAPQRQAAATSPPS